MEKKIKKRIKIIFIKIKLEKRSWVGSLSRIPFNMENQTKGLECDV